MRDQRDRLEQRQFWPRPGRPEALGEIDFDQPCGNCGYNLRGLPPGVGCPECGSRFGWNVGEEPIPWEEEDEPAPLSFFRTAFMAIGRSHDLAKNVRRPYKLDLAAAKRFRRIALWIAIPPLCAIWWTISATTLGTDVAWWCLPFNAAAITVWMNSATLDPIHFFDDKVSAKLLPRVQTIAYYSSAPLLLVPLHLFVLLVTLRPAANGASVSGALAAAEHILLLILTLALGVPLWAWLMYETISISVGGAFAMTLVRSLTWIGTAVAMLFLFPAMAAMIATLLLSKWM